jgi:hypothetical protein
MVNIFDTLFDELHTAVGTSNIKVAGLYGATEHKKFGRKVVIVGASHGKRLANILAEDGEDTAYVETPAFRLLSKDMEKLVEKIEDAMGESSNSEAVILLNLVDNSYFVARCDDGHHIPPHKDSLGHYHIDGEITCAPADTSKQLMINLFPILKKFSDYPKILLVPLPRYLYRTCCEDPEHATNVAAADHVDAMMQALDHTHKLWRGIAFREKIKGLKICNTAKLLADKENWEDDPVHPSMSGYRKVAKFVMVGFDSMTGEAGGSGGGGGGGGKRGRDDGEAAPSSIPKRPAWVNRDDSYAARRDDGGDFGGGYGGGRGGGIRGGYRGGYRGWWRRGFGRGTGAGYN